MMPGGYVREEGPNLHKICSTVLHISILSFSCSILSSCLQQAILNHMAFTQYLEIIFFLKHFYHFILLLLAV